MTEVNNTAIATSVTFLETAKDVAGPVRRRARKLALWRDTENYWHADWLGWSWAPAQASV